MSDLKEYINAQERIYQLYHPDLFGTYSQLGLSLFQCQETVAASAADFCHSGSLPVGSTPEVLMVQVDIPALKAMSWKYGGNSPFQSELGIARSELSRCQLEHQCWDCPYHSKAPFSSSSAYFVIS